MESLRAEERRWVESVALAEGFDLAGLVGVPPGENGAEEDARFAAWVEAGAAGDMGWLVRRDAEGRLVRGDVRRSMPWARSVLVCAVNYNVEAPRSIDDPPAGTGWIARYAWSGRRDDGEQGVSEAPAAERIAGSGGMGDFLAGSDYHEELLPRLEAVAAKVRARFGEGCSTRAYVDTGPILERGYAARAGVGWIGRNTCVLNQGVGSWLLLGVVVTSLPVAEFATPVVAADRCGTCTRCIEACPTGALDGSGLPGEARTMDATRCIAYLTIEKKGTIDPDLRVGMGRHVFGCDICQEVCPWNRRAPVGGSGMLHPRRMLVNPDLAWLGRMDAAEFKQWFAGSPLERTRRGRVLRNVAIAMGNSGEVRFRGQLEAWADGEDGVLAEAAGWALGRLIEVQSAG